ncbi:MAG: hypothetical protein UI647_03800, partial [Negativibacillus sp.]
MRNRHLLQKVDENFCFCSNHRRESVKLRVCTKPTTRNGCRLSLQKVDENFGFCPLATRLCAVGEQGAG